MVYVIIWVSVAVVWSIVCAIGRGLCDPHYVREREYRKLWSQLLILSPVWPLALVWLIGRLFTKAYEESGFDDMVKDWRKK